MFKADEAHGKPFRLHLLADMDDLGAGPGTSFGFVEQQVRKHAWIPSKRSDVTTFVHINATGAHAEVPDLETGMAVLMMNVKGNQCG
jgi:hypothetical protein